MESATFQYEGIGIEVRTGCRDDIEWLTEFLLPWFDLTDTTPDVEVLVRHDPALLEQLLACPLAPQRVAAFMMDTRRIDFARRDVAGEQLAFYDDQNRIFFLRSGRKVQLVHGDRPGNLRSSIMRVVREVAMGSAQSSGSRFLHASACAVDGKAIVISGPRGAGKTSLLSYLLSNSSAGFLANDRLLFDANPGARRFRGMPTIVSVRAGTLGLFPGMLQAIEAQRYTTRLTMDEARRSRASSPLPTRNGRWGLSPRQFCSLLDCSPRREARGAILLFPRQTGGAGGISYRPLSAQETRDRLQHCLFGHIGPDRLSEAFTFMPNAGVRGSAIDDETLFEELANSFAGFECALGNHAYEDARGAEQLLNILDETKPSVPRAGTRPGGAP